MLLMFKKQVSSTKWKADEFLIAKLRLLIKIKKSKGPKTDPCGILMIRVKPINWNKLGLITQVRLKPVIYNTSYSIIVEFT